MSRLRLSYAILAAFMVSGSSQAMFRHIETEQIHISRFVDNLKKEATSNPNDANLHYAIGRFYALAYAKDSETFDVEKSEADRSELRFDDIVLYSLDDTYRFPDGKPRRSRDSFKPPEKWTEEQKANFEAEKKKHRETIDGFLKETIKHYTQAVKLKPDNFVFLLGLAWAVEQSGDKDKARAYYEHILKEGLARRTEELKKKQSDQYRDTYFLDQILVETAGYLKPLAEMDPKKYEAQLRLCAEVKEAVPFLGGAITPLAIALKEVDPKESRISTLPVSFNLDGLGGEQKWNWITPQSGWLVWDPHHKGDITSGKQLFGSVTFWVFWKNGYEALATLDDDGSGWVDGREIDELGVWVDANMNGVSEEGEVLPLSAWNIEAISRSYQSNAKAELWNPQGVRRTDGTFLATFDFLLDRSE